MSLLYDGIDYPNHQQRTQCEHTELLSFNIVTKEGASQYCISSKSILEGKKDCTFPVLTRARTDDSMSYMNPLVEAFRERAKEEKGTN